MNKFSKLKYYITSWGISSTGKWVFMTLKCKSVFKYFYLNKDKGKAKHKNSYICQSDSSEIFILKASVIPVTTKYNIISQGSL